MYEPWQHNFEVFNDWAMESGYDDTLTIERIDVNGNYEPSNCKWIPSNEQAKNKRNTVNITYNGETKRLVDWCKEYKINYDVVSKRLMYGWSVEDALTKPVKQIHTRM